MPSKGQMKLFLLAMPLALTLQGCASETSLNATSACGVWADIGWSSKDTTETIIGVKRNNARREAYCEGFKP
jgi:hypothetical protein